MSKLSLLPQKPTDRFDVYNDVSDWCCVIKKLPWYGTIVQTHPGLTFATT